MNIEYTKDTISKMKDGGGKNFFKKALAKKMKQRADGASKRADLELHGYPYFVKKHGEAAYKKQAAKSYHGRPTEELKKEAGIGKYKNRYN